MAAPEKVCTSRDQQLGCEEICATSSRQIQHAKSKDCVNLSDSNHLAEVLYFHDHGNFTDTVPALVIAVSGDALILRLGLRLLLRACLVFARESNHSERPHPQRLFSAR